MDETAHQRHSLIRRDKLLHTSSHLTKSYHVALRVAMHVGHDGSGNARELEQNVENFCKKPVEWVVGPDRCASTASAPRSSRTTRSPSRAHTRRGGVSPQLQCMIKGDETRGVVACAYDTDLLVQSHGLQNLAFARARPASAASSASASASTSASASASASEFEKGLHAVIDDIIEDAVTKGYHYPAEPLCRSRNLRVGSSVADLFALGTGDDDH